jgi:hypothetical protein
MRARAAEVRARMRRAMVVARAAPGYGAGAVGKSARGQVPGARAYGIGGGDRRVIFRG